MAGGNPSIMWGFLRRIRIGYPTNLWDVWKNYDKDKKGLFS
jgi:hypothetical protein